MATCGTAYRFDINLLHSRNMPIDIYMSTTYELSPLWYEATSRKEFLSLHNRRRFQPISPIAVFLHGRDSEHCPSQFGSGRGEAFYDNSVLEQQTLSHLREKLPDETAVF